MIIKGKFKKKNIKEVLPLLKKFNFSFVKLTNNDLTFEIVESRDVDGKKALWYSIRLSFDSVEFNYSNSSAKRGLEAAETLLSLILSLTDFYNFDGESIAESLLPLLRQGNEVLSVELRRKSTISEITKAYEELQERYKDLLSMNEQNLRLTEELQKQNDRLKNRVTELEALGDDELKSAIIRWINENEGDFNIEEFSEAYSISSTRIKEMVNILIKDGYIKRIE